ncbi:MAG: (2Fe-2S)-binding protein [Planctomycetaceae bacterium]|nr:(2Fe-2S)-binding protein [Planctomycetaceae bacterium]
MELDDELCYCFHVTKRKVMNYLRRERPRVPSQLSECGGAGTGCGWCVPFLRRCFEAENGTGSADIELTPQQYESMRAEYIAQRKSSSS